MRVVSLVPSITETLLAWGVDVVACTRFCEQPHLTHVGGTKDPDVDAIVALAPDLVAMDREENRLPDAERLSAAGLRVHATHVTGLGDLAAQLDELARAAGLVAPPLDLVGARPRRALAFVPIWRRPWMTMSGDTFGASMLAHLGVATTFAEAPTRYPEVTLDDVAAQHPDVVLLPSEPYAFAPRHVAELRAVLGERMPVAFIDGQDLLWWGTRTPGALQRLGAALDDVLA